MKRTQWFPPDITPVRRGWYECKWRGTMAKGMPGGRWMNFWDGKRWHYGEYSVIGYIPASILSDYALSLLVSWRGLVQSHLLPSRLRK